MKIVRNGFTLIELMIVVAIIGTLAAIAMPAYRAYSIRAQIAEGLNLTTSFKTAVSTFHESTGAFPADNTAAGMGPPGNYIGRYVASVFVAGPVISVMYGNDAHALITGRTVTLTATDEQGSLSWECTSSGAIENTYLPTVCRQ